MAEDDARPVWRDVDMAALLSDVFDVLEVVRADVYLFGSRRFSTGSVRSDIDLLIFLERRITREEAHALWAVEPYLDLFRAEGGRAESIVNESEIRRPTRDALLEELQAVPLVLDGHWQPSSNSFRMQRVLARRNPSATMIDMYELSGASPLDRADIVVITALAEEFAIVADILGADANSPRARVTIYDDNASPWIVELCLVNGMGAVPTALEALSALRRTKAGWLVLTGLAAGVPGRVKLGDVVVPAQILYYESARVFDSTHEPAPEWRPTDAALLKSAALLDATSLPGNPVVRTDVVIACGEKVVASTNFRTKLEEPHRKIGAVEMESYGAACAAAYRGARFAVVKGVSDFADENKHDGYRTPAITAAGSTLLRLIRSGAFASECG